MSALRSAIAAVAPALIALIAYIVSLAPSLVVLDAGELAAAAWTFGVPQPTGYPLLVIISGVWAHLLPFGSVIYKLNLLSALFSALALAVFSRFALLFLEYSRPAPVDDRSQGTGAQRPPYEKHAPAKTASLIAAAGATLATGFSKTWWHSSLSFGTAPLFVLLLSLLLWAAAGAMLDKRTGRRARRLKGMLLAFILGLAFAHSSAIVVVLPLLLFLLYTRIGSLQRIPESILRGLPFLLLGYSPVLFLPVRAAAAYAWGDASSIAGLLEHLTAKGTSNLSIWNMETVELQMSHVFETFPAEFGPLLFPFILAGVVASFRRRPSAGFMAALLCASALALVCAMMQYEIAQYMLPFNMAIAIWIALGVRAALAARQMILRFAAGLLLLAGIGFQIGSAYPAVTEHDNHMTEDYVMNVLRSLKPGSLLLTNEWHLLTSPLLYLQKVEGVRTDVTAVDIRLLRKPWYLKRLMKSEPELFTGVEPSAYEYLREYVQAERGTPSSLGRLDALHARLLKDVIKTAEKIRPVCFTVGLDAQIPLSLEAVPEGMVVRVYREEELPSPDQPVYDDFVFQLPTRSDDYLRSLEHRYFRQLAARGFWLWRHGRRADADGYFQRASGFRQFSAGERWRKWALISRARSDFR